MKKEISLRKVIESLSAHDNRAEDARLISIHTMNHVFRIRHADGFIRAVRIPLYEEIEKSILTKEEAVKRHRMMWNWIAYETLKRKRRVYKSEAVKHFGWNPCMMVADCWCCTYDHKDNQLSCKNCPVVWPSEHCMNCTGGGLFKKWSLTAPIDYEKAADLAYQIANLPEREDVE